MVNTNLLRAEIVKNGLTQKRVAENLGISEQTFTRRMKKGVFGTDDVEKMISLLNIENPFEIFFASSVTHKVTNPKDRNSA